MDLHVGLHLFVVHLLPFLFFFGFLFVPLCFYIVLVHGVCIIKDEIEFVSNAFCYIILYIYIFTYYGTFLPNILTLHCITKRVVLAKCVPYLVFFTYHTSVLCIHTCIHALCVCLLGSVFFYTFV